MTITAVNTDIEFAAGAYGRLWWIQNFSRMRHPYIKTEKRPKPKTEHERTPKIPIPKRTNLSKCSELHTTKLPQNFTVLALPRWVQDLNQLVVN